MLPFNQHMTNQATSVDPGGSGSQQVFAAGGTSNMLPNLMQIQSLMGYGNPQLPIPFNNNNSNCSSNSNSNTNLINGNRPPALMNIPNVNALQNGNGHLGNSLLGAAQQIQSHPGFCPQNFGQNLNVSGFPGYGQLGISGQGNPAQLLGQNPLNVSQQLNQGSGFHNGQFGWQNEAQIVNQLGNMPLLNHSQVAALAQLMSCANQVAQAMNPQNAAYIGNRQVGFVQPNGGLQQTNFGQQLPMASQQLQNVSLPPSNPVVSSQPLRQSSNLQGSHGKKQGMHSSNSYQHQNKKYMNFKREGSNWRHQKFQAHQMHNTKGKLIISNINEGQGIKLAGVDNSADQCKSGKRRTLAVFYTEKEIQQWREERKKNYPSKANVEKKLAQKQANTDDVEEDAKLRRQQLKDVLAKQVELGFEVPEIPSHYLLDPDHQSHGRERNKRPSNNGRFQNRFNRRGRFDKNDRFVANRGTEENGSSWKREHFAKRQRFDCDDSSNAPLSIKEPTLLQKLLSTDIKRDKSRLLQALRFMVMNSFFKDWPKNPLNFPNVIVKETGYDSNVIEEKSYSLKGELRDEDHESNDGCQEEGEITD